MDRPDRPDRTKRRIVVDDRERRSGLPEALGRALGRAPEVARLDVGDVVLGDVFVIERKSAEDFVASLLDGRLAHQLARLKGAERRAVWIVEGAFDADALGGLDPAAARRAIVSIHLDWGMDVLFSRDVEDTAHWIASLEGWAHEGRPAVGTAFAPSRLSGPGRPGRRAASSPRQVQLAALARIPGVGRARAARLLERFGGIADIQAVEAEVLASTPGIGPRTVRAIRHSLKSR